MFSEGDSNSKVGLDGEFNRDSEEEKGRSSCETLFCGRVEAAMPVA